jgi:hypothetical protein
MSKEFGKTEQSKQRLRRRLAELPYEKKLKILDELREEHITRLPEPTPGSISATHVSKKPGSLLHELINHTVQRHPREREITPGSVEEAARF